MKEFLSIEGLTVVFAFLGTVLGSSGFWLFWTKKHERKSLSNRLLLGLAQVRIVELGMKYLERGWVSQDEYETLSDYLYKPYIEMGANGAATRLMNEVNKLPILSKTLIEMQRTMKNDSKQ